MIPDEEQKENQISPIDSIKLSAIIPVDESQSSSDSEDLLETTGTSSSSARLERIRQKRRESAIIAKIEEEQAKKPKVPVEEVLIARSPHYCNNLTKLVQALMNYSQDE